ncbi:PIN domain-containing protein [Negadavirga shengliensis]|uniref:PIN domain-containing protein n=1 Tax=Negadavirga shengliensis TaxID=1389218 RepID=A0ABV9SWS3_9BACT
MSRYKVLVDSSVWIAYFRTGDLDRLDRLIEEDLICTNELILTELGPFLEHQGRNDIWENLRAIENIPLRIAWEEIRRYQLMNLQNGINRVGIPDLIILQQVIEEKISLFSFDKHFKLMQAFLNYELIS